MCKDNTRKVLPNCIGETLAMNVFSIFSADIKNNVGKGNNQTRYRQV